MYDAALPAPGAAPDSKHVFFQAGDHLGSTAVVFDNQTGEVVERTTFQALGGVESDYRPSRWGSFREDYKFTGKEEDIEIGLVYFGARYYHPKLGRFASADPLTIHGAGADLNPYAYVGGRVSSQVDPLGLDNETVHVLGSRRAREWYDQMMTERARARAEQAGARGALSTWASGLQAVNPNVGVFASGLRDLATLGQAAKNPNLKAAAQGAVVGWLEGNTATRTNGIPGGSTVAALVSSVLETNLTSTPNDPSYVFARNRAHAGIVAAFAGVTGLAGQAAPGRNPMPRGAGFPGWPKIGEAPGGAVGQLTPLSCGAACGEMVSGIPQETLMELGTPVDPKLLGEAIGGQGGYVGHGAFPALVQRGPWIAMMRGEGALHYVVVDGVQGGNIVIRDPWAGGATYQMTHEAFFGAWDGIAVGMF